MQIPSTWIETTLGDIGKIISGGTPSTVRQEYFDGDIPWLTPADLSGYQDKFISHGKRNITKSGLTNSSAKLLPANSILFSSRAPIGYVVIARNSLSTNQGFKNLVPHAEIFSEYVYYYLKSAKQLAESMASGTTFKEISGSKFAEIPCPLPPRPEQKRIVAKIEELFSDLDAGIASLRKAKEQLKIYRQSVLKWAFEGKLTEGWRKKHLHLFQSFDTFVNKYASNQLSLNPDLLREYDAVGNIPGNWVLKRIGNVFNVFVGATPSRAKPLYWNGNIPWVSSGEVAFCRIKDTREKISKLGHENSSTNLHPVGTVLIGMIGEGKTRGQPAILDIKACNNQNSAAIRVSEIGFPPEFVYYYLVYRYAESRKMGSGNNQPALNKSRVQAMPIPITIIEEQNEIISEIESRLSVADNLEKTIDASLTQADALRQSILKRAFEGKLVPQDPKDEPAAELLKRIMLEKATKEIP